MGGHPYWYFVPFQDDLRSALEALRQREFKAGRYSPVTRFIEFTEPAFSRQAPGAQHATIEEAVERAGDSGTRSILDITRIAGKSDYGAASPVPAEAVTELYGTDRPTREMVQDLEFLEDIERGQCGYIILYMDGNPAEILFAGYSYD